MEQDPPAAAAAAAAAAAVQAPAGVKPSPPQGELMTDLDPKDLRILQMVEINNVCTLFEYYKLGLSMGVPDGVLTQNTTKISRLEMLVLARQLNSDLEVPDFLCDFLNQCVLVDVRQFYENKKAILPLDRALNMDDWHPSSLMDREKTIFEYALFCFVTTLCAIDHMNHADGIEVNDEERGMPSSFELMNLESGDELVNPRYDILVNEFLFQLGVRIDYLRRLGDEMYFDRDPSTWDMRLLLYKLMRGIWLEKTDGDPIGKMNKFTHFIMNAMNRCARIRTLHAIIIFLLPHRLIDVSPDDVNWVRDSLLDGWREEGTNILNAWGCDHGFVVAGSPPGGPDNDAPPGSKQRKRV